MVVNQQRRLWVIKMVGLMISKGVAARIFEPPVLAAAIARFGKCPLTEDLGGGFFGLGKN